MISPRELLCEAFGAGVAAIEPSACVRRMLARENPATKAPHILAVGKAGVGMAVGAIAAAAEWEIAPAACLVVSAEPGSAPGVAVVVGDHPVPGPASVQAADAITGLVERLPAGSPVWFLLSGGASSLIAAPEPPLTLTDLRSTFDMLLRSGLDIHDMNSVRKRITRWGGGKLGRALVGGGLTRPVLQIVISDVLGDDPATIGSGPCAADPALTGEVLARLESAHVVDRIPLAARTLLTDMAVGRRPETPKPGDPALRGIRTVIAARNANARQAAAAHAASLGVSVRVHDEPLTGEASIVGRRLATMLLEAAALQEPLVQVWGGETTVTSLGGVGLGGRCQELALAAAATLSAAPGRAVALLAAGTDGRDGPTDAAGAVVDPGTWGAIQQAGVDPERALAQHDGYPALDAAGALLRTGPTGTNVMDLVIGYVGAWVD